MSELKLEEIQQEALVVLRKIDQICRKLGIRYFLAYGTLLGAIRHKGFIPWDDDVDIMMPRADLRVLMEYFKENQEELYPLQMVIRGECDNYVFAIPRVVDVSFQYENVWKYTKAFTHGIFVDIYPLDDYGNTEEISQRICKKIETLNKIYDIYVNPKNNRLNLKVIIRYVIAFVYKLLFRDIKKIDDKIMEIVEKNTSECDELIGVPVWDAAGCFPFKKEWFSKSIPHEFEGEIFMIPNGYHEILTKRYGSYMELPPEEARKPYHGYRIYKK